MSRTHPGLSVGRRILHMSLTWLVIGAMVGAIGGARSGSAIELISGVIGGVIVLPVVGVFLGTIKGDAMGSVVGAAGGLLGCWLARPTRGIPPDPLNVEVVVVFGALLGATCLLISSSSVGAAGSYFGELASWWAEPWRRAGHPLSQAFSSDQRTSKAPTPRISATVRTDGALD